MCVDDVAESYKMTDYLIQKGHQRIAILCSSTDDASIGALRLEGYRMALKEHGIPLREELVRHMHRDVDSYSMKTGYEQTRELLKEGVEFTAIYAISDSMAIGACRALIDAGKRVPEDISLAGFDGTEMAAYYHPAICTVRQPAEEMARATIKMLFDMLKKKSRVQQRIFEGTLVEGESVADNEPNPVSHAGMR